MVRAWLLCPQRRGRCAWPLGWLNARCWRICHTSRVMPDLIDTIRKQIDDRLDELRPIVQEAAGLEAALNALAGTASVMAASSPRRRARPRAVVSGARRGRPRGQSRDELIEHVRAHPGSTAGDVAKALGLKRNSVATQLTQLAKAGAIAKAPRGYSAT
jgi:hypothetical protein